MRLGWLAPFGMFGADDFLATYTLNFKPHRRFAIPSLKRDDEMRDFGSLIESVQPFRYSLIPHSTGAVLLALFAGCDHIEPLAFQDERKDGTLASR